MKTRKKLWHLGGTVVMSILEFLPKEARRLVKEKRIKEVEVEYEVYGDTLMLTIHIPETDAEEGEDDS